ncbi:MAG: exosortase/archaeosortase family protein [Verrucomicrobiota bacterium]
MNEHPINNPPLNFWQDSLDCWRRLPNKPFFFILLAAWLALFQFLGNSILGYIHTPSLFLWMHEAYRSYGGSANDDAQGNFIPFLVIGLFWWRRKELLASSFNMWWPGLLILIAGMVLHLVGYVLQQPRISIVALFAGIYGLMGLAWGREWLRKSFFPFFLFVFSIPLGAQSQFITVPLQVLVSWLVGAVAHVLGIGVIQDGVRLIDPSGTYQYEVAAACSGMRSLIAIFLLATTYGFFVFRSLWKRLFMMALALPFAVLGNLVRMLLIIIAAEIGGQNWGNYVHASGIFSLVPYLPAIIGLLMVGHWMEKRQEPKEQGHP